MPEILEVEQYRQLADRCVGRRIARVDAPDAWFVKRGDPAALVGAELTATRRLGKLLLLDTDRALVLGLRFGMTGRLVVDGAAAIEQLEYGPRRADPAWDRFGLAFEPTGELVVSDPRRLGGVEIDPDESRLGVDALSVGEADLAAVLARSTAPLKARLMDQARLAGLGNLLTDEILWRSGLDPAREAGGLTGDELAGLHRTLGVVLDELGARGGSHTGDLHDQRHPGGVCPLDGTRLRRSSVGGRTTYSCPGHQR